MRLALALAALVVAAGPARAELDFVAVGKPGVIHGNYMGCKEQADEDRFKALAHEGDKEAAVRFGDDKFPACIRVHDGAKGVVEDLSYLHATSCFRLHGEPDCVWVPTEFVFAP